ncbi:hypothetical protein [Anaerobaca lacustris]|uniref:Uncharacterized protein n=1 Tax=Anaerobaca lacustris TaxID=3044600 RepID=A0AAW6TWM7_9BACT|nr:hypothetical protein [Sedimentisphaerales bacterium M17dextr]
MAKRKATQKVSDRFAQRTRHMRAKRLKKALRKNKMVTMRVSEIDHKGLKRVAGELGMTVTDYLLKLHQLVEEQPNSQSRGRDAEG